MTKTCQTGSCPDIPGYLNLLNSAIQTYIIFRLLAMSLISLYLNIK